MARETTFPRVFAIIADGITGAAIGADRTIAQIAPAAGQAVAIEEIIVTSTEVTEDETCNVKVIAQADDGTFTLTPADVIASVLNPGQTFNGDLYYLATVEPTDSAARNMLRHSETIRLGVCGYMRFLPGSLLIYPGERFGVVLRDTAGGVIYTVKIVCSYE